MGEVPSFEGAIRVIAARQGALPGLTPEGLATFQVRWKMPMPEPAGRLYRVFGGETWRGAENDLLRDELVYVNLWPVRDWERVSVETVRGPSPAWLFADYLVHTWCYALVPRGGAGRHRGGVVVGG